MNEPIDPPPSLPPAPPPASPAPPPEGVAADGPPPKSRMWFVVLAWVTLILFGIFVAGITVLSVMIPELKKSW